MTAHPEGDAVPSKRLKVQLAPLPHRQHSPVVSKVRKKTLEACQKCREKRIKVVDPAHSTACRATKS